MSVDAVIAVAREELGYTENPKDSNLTKYGYEYGMNGQPWCVMFLWWCFRRVGEHMAFFGGGKTASCSILLRWYREQGLTVPVSEVQAGDIVILNFRGTQEPEHCGIVEYTPIKGEWLYINTIEGNTTPGIEGSQDNGGCVAKKMRYSRQIVAVCRPQYKEEAEKTDCHGPSGLATTEDGGKDDITGHWAEDAIRWCRAHGIMEGYPDGSFKPNNPVTRAEEAVMNYRLYTLFEKELAELRKEIARK